MYFWIRGFRANCSSMIGSARTSPVWRTAPSGPSTRYLLNRESRNNHGRFRVHITDPRQWLASNAVIVTVDEAESSTSNGVFKGIGRCVVGYKGIQSNGTTNQ